MPSPGRQPIPMSKEVLLERMMTHTSPEPNTGCWLWTAHVHYTGYGIYEDPRVRKSRRAHRVVYELVNGPIPNGMVVHHKCETRCCVNPQHLEATTQKYNTLVGTSPSAINARKTHCYKGHLLTDDNLKITSTGRRQCRVCRQAHSRNQARKRKEKRHALKR